MKVQVQCVVCGKKSMLFPSCVKYGRGKTCSKRCKYIHLQRLYKGRPGNVHQPGAENPNWKGGKTMRRGICPVCHKPFTAYRNKTCSIACGRKLRSRTISGAGNPFHKKHPAKIKVCCQCSREYTGANRLFCSRRCWLAAAPLSPRQARIAKELQRRGFVVVQEKTWPWLHRAHTKATQRVDIYLPEVNVAIEQDGRHHYDPELLAGFKDHDHATIRARDRNKSRLLREHSIPLIRLRKWPVNYDALVARIKRLSSSA